MVRIIIYYNLRWILYSSLQIISLTYLQIYLTTNQNRRNHILVQLNKGRKYNYCKINKQMLLVVSLHSPLPSTSRKSAKIQKQRFFSNSSTKPNFTNIVANNDYICLYIVYGSRCFGGSSTRSNIDYLAMLVPQIQHICIIHMWRVSPFRAHSRQLA